MGDDRQPLQITPAELQMFREYARSLTDPQLVCLIDVSKFELDRRRGVTPQERRGRLKESARNRIDQQDPLSSLLGRPTEVTNSSESNDSDPLGMGF